MASSGNPVVIRWQFRYELGTCQEGPMQTNRTISTTALIAAMFALPALAQGQLPRPGQTPPPAQQKGPPPGPPGQKGQPQVQQQPPVAPPAPYAVLKVGPPKPYTDASLAAFRKEVGTAAQKKDRAALTRLVLAQGFFWLKEEGNAVGKKSGIEALSTALNLAAKDGSGWESLGEFA